MKQYKLPYEIGQKVIYVHEIIRDGKVDSYEIYPNEIVSSYEINEHGVEIWFVEFDVSKPLDCVFDNIDDALAKVKELYKKNK